MLLGATLAIGGGVVALVALIALMMMLGDPMADVPGRNTAIEGSNRNRSYLKKKDKIIGQVDDKKSKTG